LKCIAQVETDSLSNTEVVLRHNDFSFTQPDVTCKNKKGKQIRAIYRNVGANNEVMSLKDVLKGRNM
jgi:hypothetical protein